MDGPINNNKATGSMLTLHPPRTHLHASPPPDHPHGRYFPPQRHSAAPTPGLTLFTLPGGALATRPLPNKAARTRGESDDTGLVMRTSSKAADTRVGHREGGGIMGLKQTSAARLARAHGASSVSCLPLRCCLCY